ncbi:hypothetical protein VNI00_008644 [Paramarasmius palmivorus]|uniref:ER-bound oxygenase mpaB/mpaB'/Rubber oxygenase catalytic domain-containing protein n=1 Tax=Paramarasmius palmivorus TaxID=297713 RepID=A0AAW0CVQ8_9AGAR
MYTYGPKYAAGALTPEDAQKIMGIVTRYEMPLILEYALAFALFKTYAIPSISKLLAATKELKSDESISKRYADTSILISTWVQCPISGYVEATSEKPLQDPRASLAIARVNYLHSRYNIKNDDYLYTLALFMFEPSRWASKYGWRPLSPLESYAMYLFWVEIGNRMGIKDIPDTEEGFKAWVEEYESKHMRPAQTNHDVATYTTNELIYPIPEAFGLKNLARKMSIAVLDENVRVAMMFCAWNVKYFHLPRPSCWVYSQISVPLPQFKEGEEPLMTPGYFQPRPWYKPLPTTWAGWTWNWVLVKLGKYAEMPSEKFEAGGYRLDGMGPLKYEHAGREEVYRMAEKMLGCPVNKAWKVPPKGK